MPAVAVLDAPPLSASRVPANVLEVLVSLEEAAAFLGISEKHARELTAIGLLHVQHRGDECCIRFADCLDYQQKRAKRRAADRASPLEAARDLVIAKGYADLPR